MISTKVEKNRHIDVRLGIFLLYGTPFSLKLIISSTESHDEVRVGRLGIVLKLRHIKASIKVSI